MRVLVTGANGFLGSAIVRHLFLAGHGVSALIRSQEQFDNLKGLAIEKITGDIRDIQIADKAVKGCDAVIHCAFSYAFYPWWQFAANHMYVNNVQGTKNMLTAALNNKIRRFVFTSSIAVIGKRADGQPSDEKISLNFRTYTSHYVRSKIIAEKEVMEFCARGLNAVILNPAAIIGERDCKPTPTGEMIVGFLKRQYPCYFDGTVAIADVDDVARAHVAALHKGQSGERFILCDSKVYRLKEIFELLEEVSGVPAPKKQTPYPLLFGFLCLDEVFSRLLRKKPLLRTDTARFWRLFVSYDNRKAIRELGYQVTPIRDTLKKAVQWYRTNNYV